MDVWACTITLALGLVYVSLGASRIIITRLSANEEKKYDYLPVTVNVCAEAVKLLVCSVLSFRYLQQEGRSIHSVLQQPSWHETLKLMKWSVPGLLYFMDNLIGFYVISFFDPALVVLLNNFVIISTSILFRVVLKRKLTSIQWASLVILFLAIVSLSNQAHSTNVHFQHPHVHHEMNISSLPTNPKCSSQKLILDAKLKAIHITHVVVRDRRTVDTSVFTLNRGHMLVLLQCFISSSANIYNEKIFKEDHGMDESIYIQNSKLYIFGVFFNALTLIINQRFRRHIFQCGLFDGYNSYTTLLIFVTALQGLTISLILKFRDNMFHVMSQQVVTVSVITLSVFFIGFTPSLDFFLQAPTVLIVIFIYNKSKELSKHTEEDAMDNNGTLLASEEELEQLTKRLSVASDEELI